MSIKRDFTNQPARSQAHVKKLAERAIARGKDKKAVAKRVLRATRGGS